MSAVEIENALLGHEAVSAVAVIGVPDALRGLVVKAFVVPADGVVADDGLVADMQRFVRERLSAHEYPRVVSFVLDLPRTPAGKINRRVLRERELGL
jgi:acetyl-CoA synthetase